MTGTTASGVKAPFLRLVGEGTALSPALQNAPKNPDNQDVTAGKAFRAIDPSGKRESYVMRLLVWKNDDGLYTLGALKEVWDLNKYMQGPPREFKLWGLRTFADRDHAIENLEFYGRNRTLSMLEREFLGARELDEDMVPQPDPIAWKLNKPFKGECEQPMPFARPPLEGPKPKLPDSRLEKH